MIKIISEAKAAVTARTAKVALLFASAGPAQAMAQQDRRRFDGLRRFLARLVTALTVFTVVGVASATPASADGLSFTIVEESPWLFDNSYWLWASDGYLHQANRWTGYGMEAYCWVEWPDYCWYYNWK